MEMGTDIAVMGWGWEQILLGWLGMGSNYCPRASLYLEGLISKMCCSVLSGTLNSVTYRLVSRHVLLVHSNFVTNVFSSDNQLRGHDVYLRRGDYVFAVVCLCGLFVSSTKTDEKSFTDEFSW